MALCKHTELLRASITSRQFPFPASSLGPEKERCLQAGGQGRPRHGRAGVPALLGG